jgi:hypothetical protein
LDDRVKPLDESAALERVREAGLVESISALASMLNWERTRAQRVLTRWKAAGLIAMEPGPGGRKIIRVTITVEAAHDARPPAAQPPAHDAHPAHPVAHPARTPILAAITPSSATIAYLVAYGMFVVGLAVNVTFAVSYAPRSLWDSALMTLVGGAIEVLAFLSLSWGCQLWRSREYVAAVLAWLLWPGMIAMSLMAATGFYANNIGDAIVARSTVATKATNTASDIEKWRKDRAEIKEARSVDEIKLQLVFDRRKVDRIDRDAFEASLSCTRLTADVTKACAPILPTVQALATAMRRDELTKKISDAEKPQNGAPTATSADSDPQATQVSKLLALITGGRIKASPDDIALVRLLGLTIVPSLAGLVRMIAQLLAATRNKHD